MNRPINFSRDNLAVRWQYVKRNLKEMDLWQEVENNVKKTIKGTIETIIWEEFDLSIASARYQRSQSRQGYRSGTYKRSISTTHGRIDNLSMPKSKGMRMKYKSLKAYQRRQEEFDEHILKSMILGLSTRKQKKFFKSFLGDSVSHTTASKIINKVAYMVNHYRRMTLSDEYEYLYLDAIWIHIKELNIKNRPILIALGVKPDGTKHILTFKLAKSESEAQWSGLLNDLYRRGLKGFNLSLIISDNCPGLKAAINYIYPYATLQLCTVHKLRNVLSKIKNKKQNRKRIMKQACSIFRSKTKKEASNRYKRFIKQWVNIEPGVVRTMKKDIEYYFTYFNFPADQRQSLKSTNPLERINRELRRVTRRLGYFQSQRSLDIFVFLTLREDGLIIEGPFEGMPTKTIPSLEFANNY